MEVTKEDGSPLNNKEQANALRNKTSVSGQQHVIDLKDVDAEESEDTDDIKDVFAELDDFDFDNVLGK